jgi:hypothetical protein
MLCADDHVKIVNVVEHFTNAVGKPAGLIGNCQCLTDSCRFLPNAPISVQHFRFVVKQIQMSGLL